MAGTGSERVAVELCKGINGLDKVVLRGPRGSSAEVLLYNNSNDIRHLFLSFL
jgi:glucose-6-phosphate 1-epimerase